MAKTTSSTSLEAIYQFSRELADDLETRPLLKKILNLAALSAGAERASIVVLNEDGNPLDAAILFKGKFYSHSTAQLKEVMDKGLAGWVIRHKKVVLVDDTRAEMRWIKRQDDESNRSGSKSAICVPLLTKEKLLGVLTVVHPVVQFFAPPTVQTLQSLAEIAAGAIERTIIYGDEQRKNRILGGMVDQAVVLNSFTNTDAMVQWLLDSTADILHTQIATLAEYNGENGIYQIQAATGRDHPAIIGKTIVAGEGEIGTAAASGKVVIQTSAANSDELDSKVRLRGFATVPLTSGDRIIGLLIAINPKYGYFESDAGLILAALGRLAGSALLNIRRFSELEETCGRYTELFEGSIDPIIITTPQGRIIEVNRQAARTMGITQSELLTMTIGQVQDLDAALLGPDFGLIPDTETLVYQSIMHTSNGWELPVEVYTRRSQFNGLPSIQWTLRDISERVDLDTLRNDLVAMVYHDLRSPLANVTASLDILSTLQATDSNETIANLLSIAMRSSDRIQRLLNSLLDIYRLEGGQTITTRKPYDVTALIQEAVETITPNLEIKSQNLILQIDPELTTVSVDADMIRRVLINLIENASKFGGISASIEVGANPAEDCVLFWVKDNGPGIPEEEKDRIFQKFARLQQSGTTKGLGLGLAFCRLAVNSHGGKIWVDSALGEGSIFYFTIPDGQDSAA